MSVSTPGATEPQAPQTTPPEGTPSTPAPQGQQGAAGQGQQPNQEQQQQESWLASLPEDARNEILSLRREAASYRTGRKTVTQERDELATKLREIEEKDMSEAQKEKRRNEELASENAILKHEKLIHEVAKDKGVPPEWESRLRGSTKAELEQDADQLVQQLGSTGNGGGGSSEKDPPGNGGGHRDWGQGQRGGSGASQDGDMNQLIRGGLRGHMG